MIMRKLVMSAILIAAIGFTACKSEKKEIEKEVNTIEIAANTTVNFGVRGNCGMCKTAIEKAANTVPGVAKATWDVDKKKIDVSFDSNMTDAMAVHKAIAAAGYDTESMMGITEAYDNLPACCKYDHSMDMNLEGAVKNTETH